jgi:hypothetical protein
MITGALWVAETKSIKEQTCQTRKERKELLLQMSALLGLVLADTSEWSCP